MIISHYIDDYIDDSIHDAARMSPFSICPGIFDVSVKRCLTVSCSDWKELLKGVPTLRSHVINSLDKSAKTIILRTHILFKRPFVGSDELSYTDEEWQTYDLSSREELIVLELNKEFLRQCASGSEGRFM